MTPLWFASEEISFFNSFSFFLFFPSSTFLSTFHLTMAEPLNDAEIKNLELLYKKNVKENYPPVDLEETSGDRAFCESAYTFLETNLMRHLSHISYLCVVHDARKWFIMPHSITYVLYIFYYSSYITLLPLLRDTICSINKATDDLRWCFYFYYTCFWFDSSFEADTQVVAKQDLPQHVDIISGENLSVEFILKLVMKHYKYQSAKISLKIQWRPFIFHVPFLNSFSAEPATMNENSNLSFFSKSNTENTEGMVSELLFI